MVILAPWKGWSKGWMEIDLHCKYVKIWTQRSRRRQDFWRGSAEMHTSTVYFYVVFLPWYKFYIDKSIPYIHWRPSRLLAIVFVLHWVELLMRRWWRILVSQLSPAAHTKWENKSLLVINYWLVAISKTNMLLPQFKQLI